MADRTLPVPPSRTLHEGDLRLLACPVCRAALALQADCIRCSGCGRRYPVVDGIPILLAERAS